jgi:hypothetical protein
VGYWNRKIYLVPAPPLKHPTKFIVGRIAVLIRDNKSVDVLYWCRTKARHDLHVESWKPEPLSPYWERMGETLFKKWKEV